MTMRACQKRVFGREMILLIGAVLFCVPVYPLVTIPFKQGAELLTSPMTLPETFNFESFRVAWADAGVNGPGSAMISSLVITVGIVCLIIIGSLGAYAIARHPGRLGTALYILFLLGFIVPIQLAIIPLYVIFGRLGLIGSLSGMILLYTGMLMPLAAFFYTGFLRALPREYEEAARVDGAGQLRIFF